MEVRKKILTVMLASISTFIVTVAMFFSGCTVQVNASGVPDHWEYWWSVSRPNSPAFYIFRHASHSGGNALYDDIEYYQEEWPFTTIVDYPAISLKPGYTIAPGLSCPQLYANGIPVEFYCIMYGDFWYDMVSFSGVTHIEYTVTGIVDSNGNPFDWPQIEVINCPCCPTT